MSLPALRSRRLRCLAICALTGFVLTVCPGVGWLPAALATPDDDLKAARNHFDFGEYDQALAILDPGVESGQLPDPLLRDYLELRARCAVSLGQAARARDDYCRLQRLDPQWRPDPVNYTSDERSAFEAALAECAEPTPEPPVSAVQEEGRPFYAKPLVWLAAGAAAVAVLLLGGDSGGDEAVDENLGAFPAHP